MPVGPRIPTLAAVSPRIHITIVLALAATALATVTLLAAAPAAPAARSAALSGPEQALLAEMNRVRAAHGRSPLHVDRRLQRAARAHSADMLRRDYFAHGRVAARLAHYGVRARRVGENLAWGSGSLASARAMVQAWLRSPDHRANLLRRGFTRVGVAAPAGRFQGWTARVATADFAGR